MADLFANQSVTQICTGKETKTMIKLYLSKNEAKMLLKSLQFSKRKVEKDFQRNTTALNNTDDPVTAESLNGYIKGEGFTIQKINALIYQLDKAINGSPEDSHEEAKENQGKRHLFIPMKREDSTGNVNRFNATQTEGRAVFVSENQ